MKLIQNMEIHNNVPNTTLPTVAIPEKIIICLDVCSDESTIPLQTLKTALELFLRLKHHVNQRHEYALITLEATKPKWMRNFTTHQNIIKTLQSLQRIPLDDADTNDEQFNLDSLFEMVTNCIEIPQLDSDAAYSPNYLVRVIILYTRSKVVPTLSCDSDLLKQQIKSSYLFIDTIWLHALEASNEDHETIEEISKVFKFIQDSTINSYFFECDFNKSKLQGIMAKLLAHPLQRQPLQENIDFTFKEISNTQQQEPVQDTTTTTTTSLNESGEDALNIFA